MTAWQDHPRTEDLIDALTRDGAPVARSRPPFARAAGWLLLAGAVLAIAVAVNGLCPNLPLRTTDPLYVTGVAAAALTGALSVIAVFLLGLPDRSRRWGWLPLPAATLWVGAILCDCLTLPQAVPDPPRGGIAHCACVFLGLSLVLTLLLRQGMRVLPLRRNWGASAVAGLAVGGLATAALSLTRTFAEPGPLLAWNIGAGVLATLTLAVLGRWTQEAPKNAFL